MQSFKLELTASELDRLLELLGRVRVYVATDEVIWNKILKARYDAQRGVHGPL